MAPILPLSETESILYHLAEEAFLKFELRSSWGALPAGFERSFLAEAIRLLNEALAPLCRRSLHTEDIVADVRVTEVTWRRTREAGEVRIEFGGVVGAKRLYFKRPGAEGGETNVLEVQLGEDDRITFAVEILSFAPGKEIGRQFLLANDVSKLRAIIRHLYDACWQHPGFQARRTLRHPDSISAYPQPSKNEEGRPEVAYMRSVIREANRRVEELLWSTNHPELPLASDLYRSHIMLLYPRTKGVPSFLYYVTFDSSIPDNERLFFTRRSSNELLRGLEKGETSGSERAKPIVKAARELADSLLTIAEAAEQNHSDLAVSIGAILSRFCCLYRSGCDAFGKRDMAKFYYQTHLPSMEEEPADANGLVVDELNKLRIDLGDIWQPFMNLLDMIPGAREASIEDCWWVLLNLLFYVGFEGANIELLGKLSTDAEAGKGVGGDQRQELFRRVFELIFLDPDCAVDVKTAYSMGCKSDEGMGLSLYKGDWSDWMWGTDRSFAERLREACGRWYADREDLTRRGLAQSLLEYGSISGPDCWSQEAKEEDLPLLQQREEAGAAGKIKGAYIPLLISRQDYEESFQMKNRKELGYFVMGLMEKPYGVGGTANPLLICPLIAKAQIVGVVFITFFGPNGGFLDRNLRDVEAHGNSVALLIQKYRERFFREGCTKSHDWERPESRDEFLVGVVRAVSFFLNIRRWGIRVDECSKEEIAEVGQKNSSVEAWGKELSGTLGGYDDEVNHQTLGSLFGERPLGKGWRIRAVSHGSGSILSVWNCLRTKPKLRKELVVFVLDQSRDVLDEHLPELSDFLYHTLNPLGVVPDSDFDHQKFWEWVAEELRRLLRVDMEAGRDDMKEWESLVLAGCEKWGLIYRNHLEAEIKACEHLEKAGVAKLLEWNPET